MDSHFNHHNNNDSLFSNLPLSSDTRAPCPLTESSQRSETKADNCLAARKMKKADREKLRRDRLNEHFIQLGNALDPVRPKHDKATILADTVQLLKDLSSEVSKLKVDYATLTEESRELTREKNDLREEKASLKSDIEDLNIQYHQSVRSMFPWTAMDLSAVMAPTPYPFPMPMPMPMAPAPIPMHTPLKPYPFVGNQNPAMFYNHYSTFAPCTTPNASVDQQSGQNTTSPAQPANGSHISGERKMEDTDSSNGVTTDLELKALGSTTNQDILSGQLSFRKESCGPEGSSLSRCSSYGSVQDSSSDSVSGSTKADEVDQC